MLSETRDKAKCKWKMEVCSTVDPRTTDRYGLTFPAAGTYVTGVYARTVPRM